MKKAAILITILLTSAFILSCSSTIKTVQSSLVTVKVSSRTAMLDIRPASPFAKMKHFLARTFSVPVADAAIPSIVKDLRLTVTASDMTAITATVNVTGLSDADFIVEVPNGKQRHFVVEGLDTGSAVQYQGDAYTDLIGNPVLLTINMAATYAPGTYVNVNTGVDQSGCGTPDKPCQTITFAIAQTAANQNIRVAAGIYSSAKETFPLTLKTGMSLYCYGTNFSTVIDDSAGTNTTGIIINDPAGTGGTLIDGCKLNTTITSAAAINDSALVMTVNNSSVNGDGSINAVTGIQLSANSVVSNSTISGFYGGDGSGTGIRISQNASVFSNTLTYNYYGIAISTGSPGISNNIFSANANGLSIVGGSPTINKNTITNNSNSGIYTSATPTTSPLVSNNDISGNPYGIQTISQGTWTISNNTINNNLYTGIWIDNTSSLGSVFGTISGNVISNSSTTTAYGIQIRPTNDVIMSVTGNTINGNGIGIDVSTAASTVTLPTINNNNLFCNSTVDLNTSTLTALNAQSNAWDNSPPTTPSVACQPGIDICYSGTAPDFSLSTVVASPLSPCLP